MDNEKLLQCPFCGGNAKTMYVPLEDRGNVMHIFRAYCSSECVVMERRGSDLTDAKSRAIQIWNTRVYPKEVQEAIEKQKPKKPKKDIVHYRCPNCDAMLNTYETCNCCNHCGQKLDWSE